MFQFYGTNIIGSQFEGYVQHEVVNSLLEQRERRLEQIKEAKEEAEKAEENTDAYTGIFSDTSTDEAFYSMMTTYTRQSMASSLRSKAQNGFGFSAIV